ncbi:prostaglandin F2 receptor negative regulator [Latimeria chalumnae]|uniref:Prostaglandin F2 receptor inhibitor n=1 Tax=Latimeria chalumnae TaxID=7897 RepID=M3XJM1_LATCH|nr:PREDICTED: prostaglandin F2 receptor negative regulator [Latimeria chalumnae]|eukprot:XP_005993665.1 PREDICTED: prostaglandin F2 receptor negative regulator [Latimeria chalumnae]
MERIFSGLIVLVVSVVLCTGRTVEVPAGSVVRVQGAEVVIPCSVRDYGGPREQNFDWSIQKGSEDVQIISTWDNSYTSPEYEERVRSAKIALKRKSNNSIELIIEDVQVTDQGEYKCSTPSTDSTVSGSYNAQVYLKVIPDGLTVGRPKLRSLGSANITEGKSFELQCTASTATEQAHMSVAWRLRTAGEGGNGEIREVLSLTPGPRFEPGSEYKDRYQSGDIRLDTYGSDGYRLIVRNAQLGDQGTYLCVAGEWIGRTGSWQKIQEKSTEIATVSIQPIAQSLSVSIPENSLALNEGDDINLNCTVSATDDVMRSEVTWYCSQASGQSPGDSKALVHLNREGVSSFLDDFTMSRVEANTYRLLKQKADQSHAGYYSCRVIVWAQQSNGTWYKAATKTSKPVNVTVNLLEPKYKVLLSVVEIPKFSEEPTELECKLSDLKNTEGARLSVSWYFMQTEENDNSTNQILIANMDQDWSLQIQEQYKSRAEIGEMIFTKPTPEMFGFRIRWTEVSDRGSYFCAVSAWTRQRDFSWGKNAEVRSDPVKIFWSTEQPSLSVFANETRPVFSGGETFEMTCRGSAENVRTPRYSILIKAERLTDAGSRNIISLSRDSVVTLEDWADKDRVDDVALEKVGEDLFRFRIHRTQLSDAGKYHCEAAAWTPNAGGTWRQAVSGSSNAIQLHFQVSGPSFDVQLSSDSKDVFRGERVELRCDVHARSAAVDSDDLAYEVKWFALRSYSPLGSLVFLASLDRKGVVSQARRNGSSDVSVERSGPRGFRLRVHGVEDQDFGNYFCFVAPWVRTLEGSWQRGLEVKSKPILVTVSIKVLDALIFPAVLGIGAAMVVGLLACLIGYCSSRCCCKRKVNEGRRDHHHLMAMEMD